MGAHALSACRTRAVQSIASYKQWCFMLYVTDDMFHWSASAETLPVHTSAMVDISVHADGQLEQLEQLEHLEH
eukprot:8841-Amphidinium_carterae.4